MPYIHLTTFIAAPQERVFDLSRSISLHRSSMASYGEKVIEGVSSGLLNLNDTVTWKAKHLFKERRLKVRITQLKSPDYFVDEQVSGDFILLKHEHYFKPIQNGTIMIDQFRYELPYAILGKLLNKVYMVKYMTRLINERNEAIKKAAESNGWKQFLNI
jgi:ligand-binding SRPBCC domain-containing protein